MQLPPLTRLAAVAGCILLALAMPALAQEAAGRVLIAIGDVAAARGTTRVILHTGSDVYTGDTIELGAESDAQVLFTDESIVALRSGSRFHIRQYAYQGRPPSAQRAFFDLLKGGMRTITGLIAHLRHSNYAVTTPTATIGVRGTNYTLVQCDNDCRNANGTLAPNGTYGAVIKGRISVTNRSGQHEFGVDQYFRVASSMATPEQLIAPPSFLDDTLQGRARAAGARQVAQAAQSGQTGQGGVGSGGAAASPVAPTGTNGGSADTRVSSAVSSAGATLTPTTTVFQTTNAFTTTGPGTVLATPTGTVYYRLAGPLTLPSTGCGSPPCSVTVDQILLAVNYALGRATLSADLLNNSGGAVNIGTPFNSGGMPITLSGASASFNATFKVADFPTEHAFFACETCAVGHTVGDLTQMTFSGTVSGQSADVTLSALAPTDITSHSFSATLTLATPPSGAIAAMVIPRQSGGDTTRSPGYWRVNVDASGRLVQFGPSLGGPSAAVGSASNTITGSDPAAGNLVWGKWTGAGAQIVDDRYVSYTTTGGSEHWITGSPTTVLPPSLGTLTYTPVGWLVNGGGAGTLNSGSLTADFVNRDVSINLNATNTVAGNTFQMSGTSGIDAGAGGRFGAALSSVTCSGPCSAATLRGSFSGFFAGTNAAGAGVAFSAGYGVGTGVSGVVAFKR